MPNASELSALMSAQLKKGVFTNSSMTAAEYLEDDPELEVLAADGALLILRHRQGFRLLNYYVQADCGSIALPEWCDGTVVCETACKPREEETANRVASLLEASGFEPALDRIRLSRKVVAEDIASQCDQDEGPAPTSMIRRFLMEQFNALTGCIPQEHLMGKDEYVWTAEEDEITGVLHFSVARNHWEIRHLAVAPKLRGTGTAAELLARAQAAADRIAGQPDGTHLQCRVWTGAGNTAAIRFYEKHGFSADAYKSTVLIRK